MSTRSQKENPQTQDQESGVSQKESQAVSFSQAIVETTLAVPNLIKSELNKHGGYNFVSIDTYYEKVASEAARHGLAWAVREIQSGDIIYVGQKQNPVVKFTYEVDLYYNGQCVEAFWRGSVIHPYQGAQTSGSALSYADKMFMRTTFKVQTGEGDADSAAFIDTSTDDILSPPPLLGRSTAPAVLVAPPLVAAEFEALMTLTRAGLDMCKSVADCKEMWTKNEASYKTLESHDRKGYAEVLNAYKTRRSQLEAK